MAAKSASAGPAGLTKDDPAGVEDHHLVGQLEALAQVVGRHDERVLGADLVEQAVEDVDRVRVEAGVGLVEQQHPGLVQQRPGDGEALQHALGEGAHHVVAAVAELDPLEQIADAPPGVGDAVHVGVEAQVLLGREIAVEQRVVRDEADRPAHRHGVVSQVVAGDRDAARRRPQQRRHQTQRGRLAGAVGAEDGQKPAARRP